MAHPFMPFITEEIWQQVAPIAGVEFTAGNDTIMLQPYPLAANEKIDTAAIADVEWLKNVILAIRNIRGEMNVPPSKALSLLLKNGSDEDLRRLDSTRQSLSKLALGMALIPLVAAIAGHESAPPKRGHQQHQQGKNF